MRTVQSFSAKDGIMTLGNETNSANATAVPAKPFIVYAKYVRFEMVSHYGNQHYCPISLVSKLIFLVTLPKLIIKIKMNDYGKLTLI